jgi:hypothetical protein
MYSMGKFEQRLNEGLSPQPVGRSRIDVTPTEMADNIPGIDPGEPGGDSGKPIRTGTILHWQISADVIKFDDGVYLITGIDAPMRPSSQIIYRDGIFIAARVGRHGGETDDNRATAGTGLGALARRYWKYYSDYRRIYPTSSVGWERGLKSDAPIPKDELTTIEDALSDQLMIAKDNNGWHVETMF